MWREECVWRRKVCKCVEEERVSGEEKLSGGSGRNEV